MSKIQSHKKRVLEKQRKRKKVEISFMENLSKYKYNFDLEHVFKSD